jgi:hypothetical protein
MATVLSPAESLVLLKPNHTPAREAVKVTLLSLLAQGLLRIEEKTEKRFFGARTVACVRPTGRNARLPPHAASLMDVVRETQTDGGVMRQLVARARQAYGAQLEGFKNRFIMPALVGRGLIEEGRVLLLFRKFNLTPSGVAEQSRIEHDMARARTIPALLGTNPAEAAAIALAVGGTILLVEELQPHYRQLSEAMRAQGAAGGDSDAGGSSSDYWSFDDSHQNSENRQTDDPVSPADRMNFHDAGTGNRDLGSFDLGAFNAEAFSALDAGMATFDSSFDASAGGEGGGGDGGGGDGGGGGD